MTDPEGREREEIQELRARNKQLESTVDITGQKRAHEELKRQHNNLEALVSERTKDLQESEGRLRILYESMSEGLANYKIVYEGGKAVDYIITDVNPAFERITGLTRAVAVGRKASELYPTENPPFLDLYARVASGGGPEHFETYFPPMRQHFSVSAFSPGKGRFATVFTDITERKQAEESLREAELRYRTVAENTYDWEFWLDPAGHFLYCSPSCERFTGHRGEEFIADPGLRGRSIHPEDRAEFERHEREIERGRVVGRGQWRFLRPDGTVCWVEHVCQPVYGEKGEFLGIRGSNRDITERVQAEEAMRESEARFRALAEAMPQIVWSADASGAMDYYNPRAYEYGGVGPDDIRGWNWESTIHPDDIPATTAAWQNALDKGETFVVEHRLRRADGEYRWHLTRGAAIRDEHGNITRWIGTSTDIHDLKGTDEALRETGQYLEKLIDHANAPIIVWDPEFRITRFNHAFERLTGRSAEEAMGRNLEILFPADSVGSSMDHIRRVMAGERWEAVEIPILHKGGETRTVLWNSATLYESDGKTVSSAIAQGQDITDRKRAEEALRESEERYRALVDSAPEAIMVHYHGKVLYANELALDLYGASSLEELKSHDIMQLIPQEERGIASDRVMGIDEGKRLPLREGVILRLDGAQVPIEVVSSPVRYGGTLAAQALMRDITDRKMAEERIAHLASFPEQNPNPIVELNPSGEIIYVNPAASRILENLGLGSHPGPILPEDIGVMLPRLLEGDITEEVRVGGKAFLETITLNPQTRTTRIYARDITDRKQAEETLRETSQYLENLINYANAPIIVWDPEFRITRFNHAFERLTGRKAREVVGKDLGILFPPETAAGSMDHIRRAMSGERWEVVEIPIIHKDGSIRTVLWNSATLYEADGKTVSSAIAQGQDITERKGMEEELRDTSQYLENLIDYANAPIIVWDPEFRITRFNHAFEHLTGLVAEEVVGKGLEILFPAESAADSMDLIRRAMTGERWEAVEIPILHQEGEIRTVLWNSATLYEADGETVSSAIAQGMDITDRKRAEEALRETSQYLENLINHANAPIIVWDPEFRITRFNQAFERLTGRTAEEVMGKHLEILFPAETAGGSMDLITKAMAGEQWEVVEIPILRKDGGIRTVLWNSATLYEADGRTVTSAIAQGLDITEQKRMVAEIAQKAAELSEANVVLSAEISQRKKAEEAVRKALSILNAALESTADAMLVIDKAGRITSHNRNFTTMWNIPDSILQTLDTQAAIEYVSVQMRDPDAFLARIQEILNHPSRESYDMLELLDGRIIERYSKPQRIGNSIVGRVYSYRDVTERKRAELQLIESLNEKEVLLREIHHRVKNNLQLTTSLLDMTRMRTRDENTASILTDVMMKIQTMAQIHTRLYESKQFDRINMGRQIRDQVQALTNIYSREGREILIEIDSPELYLPLDKAIPCALALNEILSNAYKHAFKGRKSGTVKYSAREEDGSVRFTIRDDGVGLPPGFDLSRANTLGLKLVRTLVEQQLKGTLVMKRRKKGTEVIVELPMEEKEEEHVESTGS